MYYTCEICRMVRVKKVRKRKKKILAICRRIGFSCSTLLFEKTSLLLYFRCDCLQTWRWNSLGIRKNSQGLWISLSYGEKHFWIMKKIENRLGCVARSLVLWTYKKFVLKLKCNSIKSGKKFGDHRLGNWCKSVMKFW